MKYGTTESTFNKQKQILFITLHQQNYVIFFSGMIAANITGKVILVYILVYMNQQVLKLYENICMHVQNLCGIE